MGSSVLTHDEMIPVRSSRWRWVVRLSWLQIIATTAAAVGAMIEVESVMGFGPGITLIGYLIALLSLKFGSLNVLAFALLCPLATAVGALIIGVNQLSPDDATVPVITILLLTALTTIFWGRQITRTALAVESNASGLQIQISLSGLLGIVTITGIAMALFLQLESKGEWQWFNVYGITIIVLSLAMIVMYTQVNSRS